MEMLCVIELEVRKASFEVVETGPRYMKSSIMQLHADGLLFIEKELRGF